MGIIDTGLGVRGWGFGVVSSGRSRRGTATIVVAALLVISPAVIHGHDPGLSALQIEIGERDITGTLSMALDDARAAVANPPPTGGTSLSSFAADTIDLRIDGRRLPASVRRTTTDDSGTSVVIDFQRVPGTVLTIRSAVPDRLGQGHRQLLTIRAAGDRLVDERMFSAHANSVEVHLQSVDRHSEAAAAFLRLGVSHILVGYDHLLFLAALLLAQQRLRDVVKTVTAFTVGHSVSLGAAVLGGIDAPPWLVEPAIAASIVFVGVENLTRDRDRIGSRWKLTFAFGLVHGLGFAGALHELGVAGSGAEVAARLAFFNLGVETGQVATAFVLWPIVQWLDTARATQLRLAPISSVLVVMMGAYWLVERTLL